MIGQRASAHLLEQPQPRVGVPRLAGRGEEAQRGEIVPAAPAPRRAASALRTRVGETPRRGDAVALDQLPTAGRGRDNRARRRRTAWSRPAAASRTPARAPSSSPCRSSSRACRPAAGRAQGHVLGRLDREAAVRVHRALGPAGGAGGVDDHQQVFGVGAFGLRLGGL